MRRVKNTRLLVALLAVTLLCACMPLLAFAVETKALATTTDSMVERALASHAAPEGAESTTLDADSAGTVLTLETPLNDTAIGGDLFWAGATLELADSQVGNDVLAVGREALFSDVDIASDVRLAAQTISFAHVLVQGNVDLLGFDVTLDSRSAATGFYVGGGNISYEGKAKRFIAYGQSIYFDGLVEGDVTLSAQEIVIGPHAKVTGTLDIRSGQNLDVLSIPETAQIARIDTTLNQPNTIDQITQIRATIAPYFQVGSLLFVVVSFMLLGFAMLWGFGHKLTEAHRLIRRYPLAVLVLGVIALMLMFVAISLGALLVFTIPFAAVMLLLLLLAAICCVPFTGASLMLMLRRRIRPVLCVILGSGLAGALLFVPQVNTVVFVGSLIYFVGYLVNIGMFGHDEKHDASFHHRETDDEAPKGKASGILPVASTEDASLTSVLPEDAIEEALEETAEEASAKDEASDPVETVDETPDEAAGESDAASEAADAESVEAGESAGSDEADEAR